MRLLELDSDQLARRGVVVKQALEERALSTSGFQHPCPARGDRTQAAQNRGHKIPRGLEIAQVASHAVDLAARVEAWPGRTRSYLILAPAAQVGSSSVRTMTLSPEVAASSMPLEVSPRSIAGARLLTMTINLPTSCSGV